MPSKVHDPAPQHGKDQMEVPPGTGVLLLKGHLGSTALCKASFCRVQRVPNVPQGLCVREDMQSGEENIVDLPTSLPAEPLQ
eukprot:5675560-Lingulodinium_polyedra.AAC.1